MSAFCGAVEKAYFSWDSFLPLEQQCRNLMSEMDDDGKDQMQEELLYRLFRCEASIAFPIHPEIHERFLKRLILTMEDSGAEVAEAFYAAMSQVRGDVDCYFYKSYFRPDGSRLLSLSETRNLVSDGTTGLRTWEAASALTEYLAQNSLVIKGLRVLELGSGSGYTGISLVKLGLVDHVTVTDCHGKVLERLRHNCDVNLPGSSSIAVEKLDWSEFGPEDARELNCSVVIAADVVFDPSIVPHLANTILVCLEAKAEKAVVACTLRNEETLLLFLKEISDRDMKWTRQHFDYSLADVQIYYITK
jgi:predicted nicotinamide N-methyase